MTLYDVFSEFRDAFQAEMATHGLSVTFDHRIAESHPPRRLLYAYVDCTPLGIMRQQAQYIAGEETAVDAERGKAAAEDVWKMIEKRVADDT